MPRRNLLGWLLLGNVLLAVMLSVLAALSLKTSRDAFRQRAQIATENLAEGLAKTIGAQLTQVDMVLQTVAQNRGAEPAGLALDSLLAQQLALVPHLDSLRMLDTQGALRAGGVWRDEDRAALDADGAFARLREDEQAGLFIGAPVRDRARQVWLLGVARRLEDAQGRFAGIVQAHVPVAHFQQQLADINLGAQGAATLRSSGLQLIARHASQGGAPVAVGTTSMSRELAEAIAANPLRGTVIAKTALDGIERTSSYQRLDGYPLLVLVGIGTDEYLGPWHTQRVQVAGLVAFVMLLVAGASVLLYGAWRRESLAADRLLVESRRNQALFRTASDGLHVLDREGRVVELSESFAQMLGRRREDLLGAPASSWDAELEPQAMAAWFRSFAPGQTHRFETRHRRADGSLIEVEVHCAGVQIDDRDLIYCSARDISELRTARRRLQDVLREQQAMLDNDLVGILKASGQTTVWKNQAVDLIFGQRPDEPSSPSLRTLFPDEQAYQAFAAEAYPMLEAGGRYRQQLPMVRRDGRHIWLDVSGVLLSAERQESLWLLTDITAIKQSHQRAEHLAFHDPLTGLPNRLLLADRMAQALSLAGRHGGRLAVCYLDLDGFKPVNDRLGHAAGDVLLREIAQRLQGCVRANDTVCRIGGDEFVLLLSVQEDMEASGAVLERVCAEVARPVVIDRYTDVRVSVSIGVATFPADGEAADLLLSRADSAMYQAKKQRDQRICHYDQIKDGGTQGPPVQRVKRIDSPGQGLPATP